MPKEEKKERTSQLQGDGREPLGLLEVGCGSTGLTQGGMGCVRVWRGLQVGGMVSARSRVGGSPGVRGWEAAREAGALPGPSKPSPLLGPEAWRASHAPYLSNPEPWTSFAGTLAPVRAVKEDSQGITKLPSVCWGSQKRGRDVKRQTTEEGRLRRAQCQLRHRADTWLGLGGRGSFWVMVSNSSCPGVWVWLRAAQEPSLPIPSPMPGLLGSPTSLPLWSLSQDK